MISSSCCRDADWPRQPGTPVLACRGCSTIPAGRRERNESRAVARDDKTWAASSQHWWTVSLHRNERGILEDAYRPAYRSSREPANGSDREWSRAIAFDRMPSVNPSPISWSRIAVRTSNPLSRPARTLSISIHTRHCGKDARFQARLFTGAVARSFTATVVTPVTLLRWCKGASCPVVDSDSFRHADENRRLDPLSYSSAWVPNSSNCRARSSGCEVVPEKILDSCRKRRFLPRYDERPNSSARSSHTVETIAYIGQMNQAAFIYDSQVCTAKLRQFLRMLGISYWPEPELDSIHYKVKDLPRTCASSCARIRWCDRQSPTGGFSRLHKDGMISAPVISL
jgi:hypothetical protein